MGIPFSSSPKPKAVTPSPTNWKEIDDNYEYTYTNSIVPNGTIKRGYDVYGDSNFTNMVKGSTKYSAGDSDAKDCEKKDAIAKDIFTTDGKDHKGEHRYVKCGFLCSDCDAWPDQSDAPKGPIKGVKVPIGINLSLRAGATGSSHIGANAVKTHKCFYKDDQVNNIGWDWGNYSKDKDYPEILPDEVASGCAGGNTFLRGKYPKTLNGFKIFPDKNNKAIYTTDCYLGTPEIKQPHKSYCLHSDINKNTFCQMGDYITSEPLCQKNCDFVEGKRPDDSLKYCDYGYERLCKKRIGDPIKRDNNGNIVYSKIDYIQEDPKCMKYCNFAPSAPECKKIKNDICTRNPEEWKDSFSWVPNYCKTHWQANKNINAMNKACKSKLLEKSGEQNIWSGVGCGKLCMGEGTDVDSDWCNTIKTEYCTKSDENMLTEDCYDFCSSYPGLCDDYLKGTKGMCSRLNIKTDKDLSKNVPGTTKNYEDWCGCMMTTDFYSNYRKELAEEMGKYGYNILEQIDLSPECMYPKCKSGSIMTRAQSDRIEDSFCKQCVQIVANTYQGTMIGNTFNNKQAAGCGIVAKNELSPGVYNVKSIDKYVRVFDDNSYCEYPNQESIESDKMNHSFSEVYDIDTILDGNYFKGSCQLSPGLYQINKTGRYINVHEDYKYCEFPANFEPNGIKFTIIDLIPEMNKINYTNAGVCDKIVLKNGNRLLSMFGDFKEEEEIGIIIAFVILIILLLIGLVFFVKYIFNKTNLQKDS